MESNDIQIGVVPLVKPEVVPVTAEKAKENAEQNMVDDSVLNDTSVGGDLLEKVKKFNEIQGEKVIYGVYDNSGKGLLTKMNDFLIDHSKVTLRDKSYFFHMLAVMVDAGIPVVQAVKSLASRSKNLKFSRVLETVTYNCEHGSNLSDAMSRFEDIFDESELGIVRSGEATGRLGDMLFKLSKQLDKKHELNMKLWGAAVYPIAVFSVLILVAVGMLVWIFPTLLSLLTSSGATEASLPLATRVLITLQSGLVNYWWLILLVLFGGYAVSSVYVHSDYGAVRFDYFKIKVPIVGRLVRKVYVLRFISLLGILIEAGLPVIAALKITGNSLANRVYKLKVQEIINIVKTGGKISESLRDSEYLFPAEVAQMVSVGETSASLGKISEKIADQYDREIDNTLKQVMSVFEPVMILVVGLFVALLALAIMAPIFNLGSVINA